MVEFKKISWNDSYLIGIQEIDVEHKKLVSIINELYDVLYLDFGEYNKRKDSLFNKVLDYTVYHFEHEERLMYFFGYTGYDLHKVQHQAFISEINLFIRELDTKSFDDVTRYYSYLLQWVLNHVSKSDKVWAEHISKVEASV